MTNHPFTDPDLLGEDLADGATWLLDLVAAVDHLRRGYRPDLTVWDAVTEAIHHDLDVDPNERLPGGPDALGDALTRLTQPREQTAPRLQAAVRHWVTTMAARYNNGHHWPHPVPRRQFPPPLIET